MKRIKIFLASSIEDLKMERLEISGFIQQLNELYIEQGIFFSLIKCENYDAALAADGKQSQYDEEIRNSDMVFFLFYSKVGDYTRHEFEIALENYRKLDKPKIFTYFKYVNSVDEINNDVKEFMQMLDTEINHYYNLYENIDTLKFNMSMQIARIVLGKRDLDISDGKVLINGMNIASSSNIPIFAGNEELKDLRTELDRLTEECNRLRGLLEANKSESIEKELSVTEEDKAEAARQVEKKEKSVLEFVEKAAEVSSKKLTSRLKKSMRLLEQGNYDGALEALNVEEISRDIERYKREGNTKGIDNCVKELRRRIEIISIMGITSKRAKDIKRIYEIICNLTEEYKLDKWVYFEYTEFVFYREQYEEALNLSNRYMKHFRGGKSGKAKEYLGWFEHLQGRIYDAMGDSANAEKTLRNALKKRKKLVEQKPTANSRLKALADSHQNLADALAKDKKYKEAEQEYFEAIKIQKQLGKAYWAYNHNLHISTNNLALLYHNMGRYAESEQMYKHSIEAADRFIAGFKRQYKNKRKHKNTGVQDKEGVCRNLGCLYIDMKRYDEAEAMFRQSIQICEKISAENFLEFGSELAKSYQYMGELYKIIGKNAKAEEYYKKAIEIKEHLREGNPQAHEAELSILYNNIGVLYELQKSYTEAEKYYKKAIEIRERLYDKNPQAYESDLAIIYTNIGSLYKRMGREAEKREYLLKAKELYEKLNARTNNLYAKDIDWINKNL